MEALPDPPRPTHHDPIAIALAEDLGPGDLTSRFFVGNQRGKARIFAREAAVAAGVETAAEVFQRVDPSLKVKIVRPSGARLIKGNEVLEISGSARSILTAERVALNFLQRLSGIATLTRRFVEAAGKHKARILDTRKTTPGLRALEKAAVVAGGGANHRFGLFDMVIVKDNHIAAMGRLQALQAAIAQFRSQHPRVRVEIEADTVKQVREFLTLDGLDIILLDNMTCDEMAEAVKLGGGRMQFEASGGVTLKSVAAIAATGVDFISVGALTHSAHAIDYSLELAGMSALDTAVIRALRTATVHLPAGEIAALLHSSRDAVTASVAGLRDAGFEIDERPGLGFRLLASPDRLIADDLRARLGPSRFIRDLIVFEETDSTNDRAAQLGRGGALGGVAIFAERQTAGRGRFGRRWESAAGLGLWFSLLLRPALSVAQWPRLTTWTAVALAQAVESLLPVRCAIKWPNDVQFGGRKVAGVLIETGIDSAGEAFAVVGIGVNVNHEDEHFPDELRARATSLRLAASREVSRPELAVAVLRALEVWTAKLESGFEEIIAAASARSSLLGCWIAVQTGPATIEGTAEGLDADGQLLLRTADGILHALGAGEATIVAGSPRG